jgi:hypothetical protein
MECSKSIYMDGRSVSEFEEECYLDCHECKIAVGYKRMKVCKLPQVLNFYEVSGLLPELRILNQDYGLTCVMPERNKACLYCLLEPTNWTHVEAAGVSFKQNQSCIMHCFLYNLFSSNSLSVFIELFQFLTAHLLHLSVQCPSVSTRPCITTADPGQMRNCNVPKDLMREATDK